VVKNGSNTRAAVSLSLGVQKTLRYRPEIFGFPFSAALQLALRGPSDWSPGERELIAGFTSLLNSCHF